MNQLTKGCLFTKVIAPTATGTTTISSTVLDMANWEGVIFVGTTGTSAVDISMKAQGGATSNLADAADLLGTAIAHDATTKTFLLEVAKPRDRYIRVQVVRTTTTTIDNVIAIQYGPRTLPVDNTVGTDVAYESHVSPAAGTA